MLIDWFTVSAQAVNFLVLVWLLKRFLYKPILDAIAAREKRISDQLADASAKKAEAQKEKDDFKQKSDAFDKQKAELLSNAKKEADDARAKLLKEAQAEADDLRAKRKEALKNEEHDLNQEIIQRTKQEVFAIAAKALHDLADVSLEERMCTVFIKHLQSLTDEEKHTLASAFQAYSPSTLIASAFALSPAQQEAIKAAVREISGTDKDKLQFKIVPELVSGIELSVSGHKLAWSIADYLGALEKSVDEAMSEKSDGEDKTTPQPGQLMQPDSLHSTLEHSFDVIGQTREGLAPKLKLREVGVIANISTGIATVTGLPGVGFEELVKFPGGAQGIAFNVDEDEVGIVLLGNYWQLQTGDEVLRTKRVMDVPVGDKLIGRIINPLGLPLDGKGPVVTKKRLPIERPAPAIMDRSPVTVPLQTGIMAIDALIPVGRGQRELILGDRQTGKTAIAIDTILNQKGQNVLCVYCAIGQRASSVAKGIARLREHGAMDYTVVVVSEGNDPPGLTYIAPYAATSIAEHFMEEGRDVLIVYDDLTHHARSYREISLLLRRPPGREAFPGDIFYIHSRLLERATHLSKEMGGGSLTALPIIETEAQDISAYIPTNLISITDGQIYLSPTLFELGILPAVDVGKSVSRVGSKAQFASYRAVTGDLKLAYAQFLELETFARFGTRLDEHTSKIIAHGKRIRSCLIQGESEPMPVAGQITVLLALSEGLFDSVPEDKMKDAEHVLCTAAAGMQADMLKRFSSQETLTDADRKAIVQIASDVLAPFQPTPKPESKQEPRPEPKLKHASEKKT